MSVREIGLTQAVAAVPSELAPLKITSGAPAQEAPKNAISFERQPASIPVAEPVEASTASTAEEASAPGTLAADKPEVEKTAAEKRLERRDTWKRASEMERRATALEKRAKAEMATATQVTQWVETAKKDPLELAKILGVEPQELYRQMTNRMLNIPEEAPKPTVTPEQETKARLERLEQERYQEKEAQARHSVLQMRHNYISTNILPVIQKDPVKYELVSQNGGEELAGFVYDLMDTHYRSTGGANGGEVLKVEDVLEELENQLSKQVEGSLQKFRKVSKFSKHFAAEAASASEESPGRAARASRTSQAPRRTLSDGMGPSAPPITTAPKNGKAALPMDRNSRLQRLINGR